MRILLAGHTGIPFGGIATYCEALLASSLGKHIQLFFVETSLGGEEVSDRGGWNIDNILNALRNIFRFLFVFLHVRPHVVHIMTAQMPSMLKNGVLILFARTVGAKVILHPHCGVVAMFPEYGGWRNRFTEFVFRRSNGILVLSKEWLKLQDQFNKTPFCYVPNGIDLSPYLAVSRFATSPEKKMVNLLYLGHLGIKKGIFDLLVAIRMLKDIFDKINITLVGEPFSLQEGIEIASLIEQYELQKIVDIYSPEYGEQKLNRFVQADIYIIPSHSEGMPISIIESMAAGLPVIATSVGGIPDLVLHKKTGLLVPPEKPVLLAEAIRKLVLSPAIRLEMGLIAREIAQEQYHIENVVPKLLAFYRKTASY
jgi:glycosyltransferase involved in cell wall biosynthesis